MITILATIGIFGVLMSAMAIGVMAGRKPLRGSCGGAEGSCSCSSSEQQACAIGESQGSRTMTPPGQLIGLERLKT